MKVKDYLKYEAITELAEFLLGYGFTPKEAFKEAENFWKKHKKKLEKIV